LLILSNSFFPKQIRKEKTMTCHPDSTQFDVAMELLISNGFDGIADTLTTLMNAAMQIERSRHLGAEPYARKDERIGYANGFKNKTLKTRIGELDLSIPQTRGTDFYPKSLERGLRSERALKIALAEMYVQGVSTRKVAKITEDLCGFEVSSSEVSRASKMLDDQLDAWRNRPLGAFPYVYLDARYEKVRHGGVVVSSAVLIGIGVDSTGKREVLGVSVKLSENEVHWRDFLISLKDRGLHQNAQKYVPRNRMKKEVAGRIRAIFTAPDNEEALRLLQLFLEDYQQRAPDLVSWAATALPEGLVVMQMPPEHRQRLRTVNMLERLNKEIKRRTRVATLFPNTASCLRLITAVAMEVSDDWHTGRTYLKMGN
jgi:putative transposase